MSAPPCRYVDGLAVVTATFNSMALIWMNLPNLIGEFEPKN
jgi:hypothetical protein